MRPIWRPTRAALLTTVVLVTFCTGNGFRLRSDVDRADQKSIPTYNNAGLNSAKVTPTDIVYLPHVSQQLTHGVSGIRYAVVLRRRGTLFVGVDTSDLHRSAVIKKDVSQWLRRHSPPHFKIYVSLDPTLFNHFHRYASDRAAHIPIGSDIVLGDIERDFPGAT